MDLDAVLYVLLCVPTSVWLWTIVLVGSGFIRDVRRMPWEVVLAARAAGADRSDYAPGSRLWSVLCLGAVYFFVPFLLLRPYGPISFFATIAYVALQLGWLFRVRRAVHRIRREGP